MLSYIQLHSVWKWDVKSLCIQLSYQQNTQLQLLAKSWLWSKSSVTSCYHGNSYLVTIPFLFFSKQIQSQITLHQSYSSQSHVKSCSSTKQAYHQHYDTFSLHLISQLQILDIQPPEHTFLSEIWVNGQSLAFSVGSSTSVACHLNTLWPGRPEKHNTLWPRKNTTYHDQDSLKNTSCRGAASQYQLGYKPSKILHKYCRIKYIVGLCSCVSP